MIRKRREKGNPFSERRGKEEKQRRWEQKKISPQETTRNKEEQGGTRVDVNRHREN